MPIERVKEKQMQWTQRRHDFLNAMAASRDWMDPPRIRRITNAVKDDDAARAICKRMYQWGMVDRSQTYPAKYKINRAGILWLTHQVFQRGKNAQ